MIVLPEVKLDDIYDVTATYKVINKFLCECHYEYRVPVGKIMLCHHRTMQYVNQTDMWTDILDTLDYCSSKYYANVNYVKGE